MTPAEPWPPGRICPATSNLPTRMLPASWRALCAAMQRREVVGVRSGGQGQEDFMAISAARFPCATCAGRTLPPGLELITQEEASEMARTTKRGTCELCGANSNVGTNHGSKVCTKCTHIQSALSQRPQSVANAIRAMGKVEDLLGYLIPAGGGIAVKMTADFLQEISGLVDYDGEDPGELVAAVRKRVLTCASCDSEDVLHEIREIVGYVPEQGDKGLADAVRQVVASVTPSGESEQHRDDLMRACGFDKTQRDLTDGWELPSLAAIQTIAELTDRGDRLLALLTKDRADNAGLRNEISRLSGQTRSESEQVTALRAELTLAQQSRDEWGMRAVRAESNVETLEAELRNRDAAPAVPSCEETYLLDLALTALRGGSATATQLAALIDAARRAE